MRLETLDPDTLARRQAELADLLRDAVGHGASIGFTLPLTEAEVADYWRKVGAELAGGNKVLFAAYDETDRLVGCAQLALEARANGRHRAEVQKVLVLAACRGRGIGAALMQQVETVARARGRTLLFLDTSAGTGGAVEFYERLGYSHAGGIPDYAADPDGRLKPNVIFYKRLALAPGGP
jgi:acetyltransferase